MFDSKKKNWKIALNPATTARKPHMDICNFTAHCCSHCWAEEKKRWINFHSKLHEHRPTNDTTEWKEQYFYIPFSYRSIFDSSLSLLPKLVFRPGVVQLSLPVKTKHTRFKMKLIKTKTLMMETIKFFKRIQHYLCIISRRYRCTGGLEGAEPLRQRRAFIWDTENEEGDGEVREQLLGEPWGSHLSQNILA